MRIILTYPVPVASGAVTLAANVFLAVTVYVQVSVYTSQVSLFALTGADGLAVTWASSAQLVDGSGISEE